MTTTKRYTVYDRGHGVDVMLTDSEYDKFRFGKAPFQGTRVETGEVLRFAHPERLEVILCDEDDNTVDPYATPNSSLQQNEAESVKKTNPQELSPADQKKRKGSRIGHKHSAMNLNPLLYLAMRRI